MKKVLLNERNFYICLDIPVFVVQMLPDERVWLHRPVGVHLWHVHVVEEIHQLLVARRTVVLREELK